MRWDDGGVVPDCRHRASAVLRTVLQTSVLVLAGCGSGSLPDSGTGALSGTVTNRGPIDHVRIFRSSITAPVDASNGAYSLPQAPPGPVTLEFLDPNERPFGYAQVVVEADTLTLVPALPGPQIGAPADPTDPSTSFDIPSSASSAHPVFPTGGGVPMPADIDVATFGGIAGQVLLSPGGSPLTSRPVIRLVNVQLQGGPSGSVGQNPSTTDPQLVAANANHTAGIDPSALSLGNANGAIFGSEDNAALMTLTPDVQAVITSQAPPSTFFTQLQPQVIAVTTADANGAFRFSGIPPGLYALVPSPFPDALTADILMVTVEPATVSSVELAYHGAAS